MFVTKLDKERYFNDNSKIMEHFTQPLVVVWVFRWTFSPSSHSSSSSPSSPSSPHHQVLFLLGTENAVGGVWVIGCVCHLV